MSAAEKTERVMGALMDHLRGKYGLLSSSNVFRLQTNAAGTLTLILDLLSPKIDGADMNTTKSGEVQFLRDVNCGLQYLPTFQIVFTPMAIVSDQDSPPPSSRTLFNVLLVNYQGTVLKKDFMTFYVNFPVDVIEAARSAAAQAAEAEGANPDDVVIDPDVELAEKTSSNCELMEKLDRFREFRLCCGIRKNRRSPQLKMGSVFVEPFGDAKGGHIVRSRECKFMLEIESVETDKSDSADSMREPSTVPENCHACQQLETRLTEIGVDKLKQLSRVKVEVRDENTGATIVLPIESSTQGTQDLLRLTEEERGHELAAEMGNFSDDEEGKENETKGKVVVAGAGGKSQMFKCDSCVKEFRYIDSYWRHTKRCTAAKNKLSPQQASMMVTVKASGKHTCTNCGRDFFHEVNWKKHEELCKIGRVKRRAIFKQQMTDKKRDKPKPASKKVTAGGDGEDKGKVKEAKECLICLKKVGNQWERHIKLHKERVGEKLYEQTVCPSWDCEEVFEDRIKLNKHFLEVHDVEAIPCVYCVRLILKDRIMQHLRNEHPHMSHLCTECGRECIYPSALKQHIREVHGEHKEERVTHMCDLCGKVFRRAHGLKYHVLGVHQKKRDHVCPHCGKKFLINSKLTEHMRIHTGEKPYKCFACDYRSNRHGNVRLHVQKVHKISNPNNEQHLIVDHSETPAEYVQPAETHHIVQSWSEATETITETEIVEPKIEPN